MRDKQIFLWINLLIWLFIQEVNGQNKIHGTVLDANGKYPLIGASVMIEETSQGSITDAHGGFEITNVIFPVQLKISFVGYETIILNVKDILQIL